VFEVLGYAFDWQGFFIEGLVPDFVAPAGNPFVIPALCINLPDPSGVPITCRPDQDFQIETSK
jgi:hypothetical protein